jgi:hypothetical protein
VQRLGDACRHGADAAEREHPSQGQSALIQELRANACAGRPLLGQGGGLVTRGAQRLQGALDQLRSILGEDGATIARAEANSGVGDIQAQVPHAGRFRAVVAASAFHPSHGAAHRRHARALGA